MSELFEHEIASLREAGAMLKFQNDQLRAEVELLTKAIRDFVYDKVSDEVAWEQFKKILAARSDDERKEKS
jgi:signal transduction histidine kinase